MSVKRAGVTVFFLICGFFSAPAQAVGQLSVTPASVALPASGTISFTFSFSAAGFSPDSAYGLQRTNGPAGPQNIPLIGTWMMSHKLGGSAYVFVTGPYTYDATITPGIYTYQAQDSLGNPYTTTITVLPPPSPTILPPSVTAVTDTAYNPISSAVSGSGNLNLVIWGANFSTGTANNTVYFGNQTLALTYAGCPGGACQINAVVPNSGTSAQVAGTYNLTVQNANGISNPPFVFTITAPGYQPPPPPTVPVPPSPPPPPTPVTMNGVFEQVAEDQSAQGTGVIGYALSTSTGYFELVFPNSLMAQGIASGSQVRVKGQISGSSFIINKVPSSSSGSSSIPHAVGGFQADLTILSMPAAAPATSGVRKIAIVLVNYTDNQTQPMTSTVAGEGLSLLNQYFQEVSYGQLSASGDVFGYLQLPLSIQTNCASDGIWTIINAGLQAAQNAGTNLSSYQSVVFEGPAPSNCPLNEGTIGGVPTGYVVAGLLSQVTDPKVEGRELAHEIGHNLGMDLALAMTCGSTVYSPTASCQTQYANLLDVMGIGNGHYNAAFKDLLGWLSPQTISITGIYNLAPLETPSASYPLALKIAPLLGNDVYYVEYRQPIGFDAGSSYTQEYSGALFNLAGNPTEELNMNPNIGILTVGAGKPALSVGSQYIDYANRFSVTTLSTSTASMQLRILVPPLNSPTLMIVSPADGASVAGSTLVTVDALDRTGVTKVELYKDGMLLGTQTAAPYQFTWNTSQEVVGSSHMLMATAYNAAGATYSQTITVQVKAGTSSPAVSLASPLNGSSYQVGASVAIKPLIQDPNHVATLVDVFVNGQLACSNTIANNCEFSYNGAVSGNYQLTAELLDAQNVVKATATPANFTVTGAATPLSVQMVNPLANSVLAEGMDVPLSAQVGGTLPSSLSVVFMVNGAAIGVGTSVNGSVFNLTWPAPPSGTYSLVAQVISTGNPVTLSAALPVTVQPGVTLEGISGTLTTNSVIEVQVSFPAESIHWVISPADGTVSNASAALPHGAFPAPNAIYQTVTTLPQLNLGATGLLPGRYRVAVAAVDLHGQMTAPAEADIVLAGANGNVATVDVYPNPWRSDQDTDPHITFANLSGNTTIKLFTLSGHWIKTLTTSAGSTPWDLTNDANEKVASGIYFYLLTNDQGRKTRGKLGVIR